jgi:hypothetical protein
MATTTARPCWREVALWLAIALLGLALYGEHNAVPGSEEGLRTSALYSASAAEAIISVRFSTVQYRIEDVDRQARESMQTLKHEVH